MAKILNNDDVILLNKHIDKYNSAKTVAEKNYHYGFIEGFTYKTNYKITYDLSEQKLKALITYE